MMKILGIDPGLALLGWSILEAENNQPKRIHYGCIETPATDSLTVRLQQAYTDLMSLIKKHKPTVLALETLFFAKNAKTLAHVGHARGIILLAAGQNNLDVHEYAPRQIKLSLTGYGAADKKQMQQVVMRTLGLTTVPKPDDAADAVAIALCHLNYPSVLGKTAVTV